jgi:hypothetical protein
LRGAVTCREGGKESDREESIDGFHGDGAFRFVALEKLVRKCGTPIGASDIGAMRANSYLNAGWGCGPEPSIPKEKLKTGTLN